jgi:hypothetical protein
LNRKVLEFGIGYKSNLGRATGSITTVQLRGESISPEITPREPMVVTVVSLAETPAGFDLLSLRGIPLVPV